MKRLQGIIVPLVTPLKRSGMIDAEGVRNMVEFEIASGIAGIFPLGSTGEGAALTLAQRKRMVELTVRFVGGRVPVLTGVVNASMLESLEFARFALEAGSDALVVSPPCFLPPEPEELKDFYRAFCDLGAPVCIYNMPALTGTDMMPELLAELAELPNVAAIKDSSGNFANFKRTLALLGTDRKVSLLMGPEAMMLDAVKLGADGGVNSGANLRPDLFCGACAAYRMGDPAKANALQQEILEFEKIYGEPITTSSVIRGLKHGLAQKGMIEEVYVPPFTAHL